MFPTAAKQWFQQKPKNAIVDGCRNSFTYFPACQMRIIQLYVRWPRLPLPPPSFPPPSPPSPALSCQHYIAMAPAGPEQQAQVQSVPRRISTANCFPPDINCKLMIALAPTGPEQQARDEKCSPPDLICKLVIAAVPAGPDQFPAGPHLQAGSRMFPTGPQLKTRERSGPRRTRTVTAGSK